MSAKDVCKQIILACQTCGSPNGNCDPEPHRDGIVKMTKMQAAKLALNQCIKELIDAEDSL